jgi:hypothetical protein
MDEQHEISRRSTAVKRTIIMAIGVLLALALAAPIASGKQVSTGEGIGAFTDNWWNWAFENPSATSPLLGDYSGGEQCDGFQQGNETGVWFLGGEFSIEGDGATGFVGEAKRHCTVPADTPILFPVVNFNCGEAPTVDQGDGTLTGDPKPYTKCAKTNVDDALDPSAPFATINGADLPITRAASGLYTWEVPTADNPQGIPAGSYTSATDGLWVYLPDGLAPGNYTINFGGSYTPFDEVSFVLDITYKLKVQ